MMVAMLLEGIGGAALAAGGLAWAVRAPRATLLAPSIHRLPVHDRSIALTFDDGPSESTPRILDILERYGARATFFACGANVDRLPLVAQEVSARGHEVANHAYSHPMIQFKSFDFIDSELRRTQAAIERAAGVVPRLFRPPFGIRWFGLREVMRGLNLTAVMWTVIARDWRLTGARAAQRLLRRVSPGSIVCLHDGRETRTAPDVAATIDTIQRVLPIWTEQGYRFDTVSRILWQTN